MVNPKIATLTNQFKLHELKFRNASNYLASRLDSDQNSARLRQNFAQLQTIACRLEELAEQMSAHMPLEELEPFLQISADTSLQILQIADQIETLSTTELTHATHSQSSPGFTAVQLRCDEFKQHQQPQHPQLRHKGTAAADPTVNNPLLQSPRIEKPLTS